MILSNAKSIKINNKQVNQLSINGEKVWDAREHKNYFYIENIIDQNITLTFISPLCDNLQISEDKTTWWPITEVGESYTMFSGMKLYLCGTLVDGNQAFVKSDGHYAIGGNILSIANGEENGKWDDSLTTMPSSALMYAFAGTSTSDTNMNLRNIDNLVIPLTTIPSSGLYGTFAYTAGLTSIPEGLLDSVTTINESGCKNMFYYCASIRDIPQELLKNVTTINMYGCDGMFRYCNSLLRPCKLYATTYGTYACQYMFNQLIAQMKASSSAISGKTPYSHIIPEVGTATSVGSSAFSNMYNKAGAMFDSGNFTPTANTTYYGSWQWD